MATQPHAWIHLLATLIIAGLVFHYRIDRTDTAILLLCCMGVWCAEALNTSVEFLGDQCSSDYTPLLEKAKDVAAAAVLLAAVFAIAIGVMILKPYLLAPTSI